MAGLDSERAQKVARKLPAWAAVDADRRAAGLDPLEFPSALSLEQCSSSATALYKAHLAGQAATAANLRFAHPSHAFRRGPLPFTRPWVATGLPAAPPDPADKTVNSDSFTANRSIEVDLNAEAVAADVPPGTVLDLTGGLGVDSWAFAQVAERVVYFERNEELAAAAGRNFQRLGAGNIDVRCKTVTPQTELPEADLIYADPARRDAAGRKVFLLEDCTPDILTLLPMLLRKAPAVLVKLSPMADLAMLADRLGPALREIHVVECDGEVKELLCLLLRDNNTPEPDIVVARLSGQAFASRSGQLPPETSGCAGPLPLPSATGPSLLRSRGWLRFPGAVAADVPQGASDVQEGDYLRFRMSEERAAEAVYAAGVQPGDVLLEPCPALLKAGAFRLPCARWALRKLAPSTHLYLLPADSLSYSHSGLDSESLPALGTKTAQNVPGNQSGDLVFDVPGAKTPQIAPGNEKFASPGAETGQIAPGSSYFKAWRIVEVLPFGAAAFKALKQRYPRADVTARNLPLGSAELQKRLGVASGGAVHIFGCRLADGSTVLFVTEPV